MVTSLPQEGVTDAMSQMTAKLTAKLRWNFPRNLGDGSLVSS